MTRALRLQLMIAAAAVAAILGTVAVLHGLVGVAAAVAIFLAGWFLARRAGREVQP